MRKRTLLPLVFLALPLTGCNLFEDGSVRTEDGIGFCLFPEMGCTPAVDLQTGPPPVPSETVTFDDMFYGPCAEAPIYAEGVQFEWSSPSTCSVRGTSEQLDTLFESAFRDV